MLIFLFAIIKIYFKNIGNWVIISIIQMAITLELFNSRQFNIHIKRIQPCNFVEKFSYKPHERIAQSHYIRGGFDGELVIA